jgi:hypothetical protein
LTKKDAHLLIRTTYLYLKFEVFRANYMHTFNSV